MYTLSAEEVEANPDVVAGILYISGIPAYTLFNSGASHSFISKRFARKIDMTPRALESKLIVSTPTDKLAQLNGVYGPCPVEIGGKKLDAQLIKVNMQNFDVILGMDWLSAHQPNLMCTEKQIRVAVKLLEDKCQCYLVLVQDVDAKVTPLEELNVVIEFLDVFLDDITWLPPDKELEFAIDLVPGAAPVSKAPYKMAPPELKELRTQL
ncbi:uncharacterized protein LOC122076397 [Macadamia integrifolia]|uniref:uncharacterized protein LOC122076397 n=1 Tax=Macadamia integrifolia TaxID=60698 RepID=UPI001C4F0F72|nr:uncharacterized protein LOC122076397 [Macadamia integrifolia]